MGNEAQQTVIIGNYNSEKKELNVQIGFSFEELSKNESLLELAKIQELDENNVKLTELNEENLQEVVNLLNKQGNSLLNEFFEKISLEQFSEEIENGIEVLRELSPDKFKEENLDDSVLIIDDIISTEEQLFIFKEKITENLTSCPLINNTFKSVLDLLDNMATTKGVNNNSLKNLSKELFGVDNPEDLSVIERLGVQKMAVVDFLIKNSDIYLSNYVQISSKLKNLI